jgi:septal ring factor EnvC (AmiA/AmiB activator)
LRTIDILRRNAADSRQQTAADIDQQSARLKSLESDASREMAGLEHARAERAGALAALTLEVASGNEELANLKREEQAVESLVADLAWACLGSLQIGRR